MKQDIKLIDLSEVCNILGVSRSTLYRWCDIKDSSVDLEYKNEIREKIKKISENSSQLTYLNRKNFYKNSQLISTNKKDIIDLWEESVYKDEISEIVNDFPRPFKIGRQLKWNYNEIINWLERKRI